MVVALQQVQNRVAETRPDLPADAELAVDRLTPTAFPFFIMDVTGGLRPPTCATTAIYVMRPALARVAGVGRVEILSSDTREIEVILDPAKLVGAGLTVNDVSDALKDANVLAPAGRFTERGTQHLVLASGLWQSADDIATTPVAREGRNHDPRARRRHGDIRRARPDDAHRRRTARTPPPIDASPSRSAPTSSTVSQGVETPSPTWSQRCPRASRSRRSTTSRSSLSAHHQRPRRHPHRRLPGGHRAARSSCATGA